MRRLSDTIDLTSVQLETPRCILKPVSLEGINMADFRDAYLSANEQGFANVFCPTFEQKIENTKISIDLLRQGYALPCFIVERSVDRILGGCGIFDYTGHRAEIGIWIRKEAQRSGYGSEVCEALINWTRAHMANILFLDWTVHKDNISSQNLVKRLGGTPLGKSMRIPKHLEYSIPLKKRQAA